LTAKVKVLFLVSNPCKQDRLALDEETRAVAARIRSADHRDALELIPAWAVRTDDLQPLLLRHKPHVVHFSGHGALSTAGSRVCQDEPGPVRDMIVNRPGHAEQLVLAGEGGEARLINQEALVDLFSVLEDNVHVVIFNTCHSDQTAKALAKVVPCTIGMKGEISDEAAIAFAAAFYQALGFGRDVQAAFNLGKNALMYLRAPEDQRPRLYSRPGKIDPSKVILVGTSAATSPGPAGPSSGTPRDLPTRDDADDNLLHTMWHCLDDNLQDAFSLAYNKKRRQGGNRISTKDFFQALARLEDDSVKRLIGSLPVESLPDPIDAAVTGESRLVLQENPLLSDCVADSLEHFKEIPALPRKLSAADIFVDIAKHGHGESVSRLRQHGIGKKEIEERVSKLGLPVLRRVDR
jgi:hypothetical protein